MGLKNSESQYRISRQHLLPKFPRRENPFRATVMPEAGCACASPTAIPADEPAGEAEAAASAPRTDSAAAQPSQSLARRWIAKLRALRGSRKPRDARRTAAVAVGRGPVQIEMSLDAVKVLRNDLSDTDFEVVPAAGGRAASRAPGRGKAEPAAELGLPATAWGRVTGRFLGAGKS